MGPKRVSGGIPEREPGRAEAVASDAIVQENSDLKPVETSFMIKRGEGENLQLPTVQVRLGIIINTITIVFY